MNYFRNMIELFLYNNSFIPIAHARLVRLPYCTIESKISRIAFQDIILTIIKIHRPLFSSHRKSRWPNGEPLDLERASKTIRPFTTIVIL